MGKFTIRSCLRLSAFVGVALGCAGAVLVMQAPRKMPIPISTEQALVDRVIAFNNQPIRVAEAMTPEQYFGDPRTLELCHAISEKQHERVRELMPSVDLNTQGSGGITLLYWAYFSNDLESFKLLLQAGADPDLRLDEGYLFKVKRLRPILTGDSIFFALIEHSRYDFFYAALPYTADVHQKGAASQNFLHRAVVYTSMDRENLARLVDLHLDMNSRDAEGETILECISRPGGGWGRMKWLLELGADQLSDELLNQVYDEARVYRVYNDIPRTIARWIEEHCQERIERIAVSEGLMPSQFFHQPAVIELCRAISEGDFQGLQRLIEIVDINTQGANGITPLYWAYFAGNIKAFELLLEAGANPDEKLTGCVKFKKKRLEELQPQDSILFTLVRHDRYDYFFLALSYSADVRKTGFRDESLLHAAIRSQNIDKEIMLRLVNAGVDVNACDRSGAHVFQSAIERSYTTQIVFWGLEIAADKMSTATLLSIYDAASKEAAQQSFHHNAIVEWIEKHIPERIPIARRRPVPAGVVDYD